MRNNYLILILCAISFISTRSFAQATLKIDSVSVACNATGTVSIPMRVKNFTNIGSFQGTINWDPAKLSYVSPTPLLAPFTGSGVNFGLNDTTFLSQGKLTFSWSKLGGITVVDTSIVFYLKFNVIGGGFAPVGFQTTGTPPTAVEITDRTGLEVNAAYINGGALSIDTQAPSISCPSNVLIPSNTPFIVNNIAPASISENCGTPVVGHTVTGVTNISRPNDGDASGSNFNVGISIVTYTAIDAAGNTGTCAFVVNIDGIPDTGPDTLTVTAGSQTTTCGENFSIPVSVAAFDSIGSLQFSMAWDPNIIILDSVGDMLTALSLGLDSTNFNFQQTADGRLAFSWTTTGIHGNTLADNTVLFNLYFHAAGAGVSSLSFTDVPSIREAYSSAVLPSTEIPVLFNSGTVSVLDNTAPTLTCPENIIRDVVPGSNSVTINGLLAAVSDNCGTPTVTYAISGASTNNNGTGNSASGAYNVGTSTVTFSATDGAGNNTTCSFTVRVRGINPVTITLDTVDTGCSGGQTVSVPIRVTNFADVTGLSFNVSFDETELSLTGISNIYPGLNLDIYDQFFQDTASGEFHFLGGLASGWPNIPDGGIFFSLDFKVLNPNINSALTFYGTSNIPIEALDGNANNLQIESFSGLVLVATDVTAPVLADCPANFNINLPNGPSCTANLIIPNPTATDDCSSTVTVVSNHPSPQYSVGVNLVVFTATDSKGNSSTCSVLVTVRDQNPPILNNCPADTIVSAVTSECNRIVNISAPTASDCNPLGGVTSSHPSNNFSTGTTVVVFTATDFSGNTSTCSVSVTVVDSIKPQIFCPQNVQVSAAGNQCVKSVSWPSPQVSDGCGNSVLTVTSSFASGSLFPLGITTVEYKVTDNTNLSATCSFTVTVRDTVKPELICPPNQMLAPMVGTCSMPVNWTLPTGTDNCDTELTFESEYASGDTFLTNTVTQVIYYGFDNFGNAGSCSFTINIVDITPPIISNCPTDTTVNVTGTSPSIGCGTPYSWDAPTLTGVCTQDGLFMIPNHNSGDFFGLGVTEVIIKGFNANGYYDSCQFVITVVNDGAIAFDNFPGNYFIELPAGKCDTALTWPVPTVSQICGIDTLYANVQPGSVFQIGNHTVTYTAVDNNGNTLTRSFFVQVVDNIAPVLSNCPQNVTVNTGSGCQAVVTWDAVAVTDNCDTMVDIFSAYQSGDIFFPGETTVRIIANDNSNNTDTCEFKVLVQGSSMPLFQNCPPNLLFNGCEAVGSWILPSAVGFCSPPEVVSNFNSGATFPLGVTQVVYTAADSLGNTASCNFTVTVNESISPSLSCPSNVVVEVSGRIISDPSSFVTSAAKVEGCAGALLNFNIPTANDNCGVPVVVQTVGPITGTKFEIGMTTLTFRATDAAGNTATCSVRVTVSPLPDLDVNIEPNLGCENEMVVLTVENIPGATYTWTGPQQNYPNANEITITSLSTAETGIYTVFSTINGCISKRDTAEVNLVVKPDAVDDFAKVKAGESTEVNVLLNDGMFNEDDAFVSLVMPVEGVSYTGNGIFAFSGNQNPGSVSFLYDLCSKTCPEKCDRATVTITIQDTRCVFIPNIISPNGDGINDWFDIPCIETGEYPNNELTIYNQWGDKVFEAAPYISTPADAWKGTLFNEAGKDLPDGVYYYIFKPSPTSEVIKKFIEIYR